MDAPNLPFKSLLIVDDDPFIPTLLEMALHDKAPELSIACATNGKEAAEYLQAIRPDLILSDVLMPTLDGSSLLLLLQSMPNTRNIPIVFFTALSSRDLRHLNLEQHSNVLAVLRKPLDPHALFNQLTDLFIKYSTEREPRLGGSKEAGFSGR